MNSPNSIYQKRIDDVIEHVNRNLNESLKLDDLANVACFSSFHFHRIFMAVTGETVHNFTNRMRIERAAKMVRGSKKSISSIALESGFSSSATFSRAFKEHFGVSASTFKKSGQIENSKIRKSLYPIKDHLAPMNVEEMEKQFPVVIKKLPERRIAFIRIVNSFREGVVLKAYEQMIKWAKDRGIYETETIFGMSLDDVMITPKEKYRYEVCFTIPADLEVKHPEISTMTLPACKYGTTVLSGDINTVATAFTYLFNHWLVNSDYEPEHLHAMEVFLDKANVCNWDHFDLELYIPIKQLGT